MINPRSASRVLSAEFVPFILSSLAERCCSLRNSFAVSNAVTNVNLQLTSKNATNKGV